MGFFSYAVSHQNFVSRLQNEMFSAILYSSFPINSPSKKMRVYTGENFPAQQQEHRGIDERTKNVVFGELLHKILSSLPTRDLLPCRLVSLAWSSTSQKILLHRSDHRVVFLYDHSSESYFLYSHDETVTKTREKSLSTFTRLISPSSATLRRSGFSSLFCTRFEFRRGNLECPDAQFFFLHFGSSIKELRLDLYHFMDIASGRHHTTTLESFSRVLTTQVPQMESLIVTSLSFSMHHGIPIEIPAYFLAAGLPQLKILDISGITYEESRVIHRLIEAATNLEVIYFQYVFIFGNWLKSALPHIQLSRHRIQAPRVYINSLPETPGDLELVEKFSQFIVGMTSIDFKLPGTNIIRRECPPQLRMRAEAVLLKIFTNGWETLQKVEFGATAFLLLNRLKMQGKLPHFPRVTELTLRGTHGRKEVMPKVEKSEWFKMSRVFPNVTEVRIEFDQSDSPWPLESYCPPFSTEDQLPGVKKLSLYGCRQKETFSDDLHLLYPNVEKMTVTVRDFSIVARHLWKFEKIVDLRIIFDLRYTRDGQLDEDFTGFSQGMVRGILGGYVVVKGREEMERMRVHSSIMNLKALQSLDICMYDSCPKLKTKYNVMTSVTGLYAFGLIPNLKIQMRGRKEYFYGQENLAVLEESLQPLISLLSEGK